MYKMPWYHSSVFGWMCMYMKKWRKEATSVWKGHLNLCQSASHSWVLILIWWENWLLMPFQKYFYSHGKVIHENGIANRRDYWKQYRRFLVKHFGFAVRTKLWCVNASWHPSTDFRAQWGGWFGVVHYLEDTHILSSSCTPKCMTSVVLCGFISTKVVLICTSPYPSSSVIALTILCWKCLNKVRNSYPALVPGICVQNKWKQF